MQNWNSLVSFFIDCLLRKFNLGVDELTNKKLPSKDVQHGPMWTAAARWKKQQTTQTPSPTNGCNRKEDHVYIRSQNTLIKI